MSLSRDEALRLAYESLSRQHEACRAVLGRMQEELALQETSWNSVPVAIYWSRLPEHTVHFFGYAERDNGFALKYWFGSSTGTPAHYSDVLEPRVTGQNAWCAPLVFIFSSALAQQSRADLEAKAEVAIRQHLGVRNFFRRLAAIEDLAAVTRHLRNDAPVLGGRNVDAQTYYRLCMVVALSATEALLHDLFFSYSRYWFNHLPEGNRVLAMRNAVEGLAGRGWAATWAAISQASHAERAFTDFLQPGGRSRISFQDLRSKRRGAKWAYQHFFGIHLPKAFERAEKDAWRTMLRMTALRHAEIHPGTAGTLDRHEVDQALAAIRNGQCALLGALMESETLDRSTHL